MAAATLSTLIRQRLDTFPRRRASPFTDSRRQRFVRDRVIANPVHRSKVARAIGSGGDDLPADLTDLAKDHAKKRQGLGPLHDGSDPDQRLTPGYAVLEACVRSWRSIRRLLGLVAWAFFWLKRGGGTLRPAARGAPESPRAAAHGSHLPVRRERPEDPPTPPAPTQDPTGTRLTQGELHSVHPFHLIVRSVE